MNTLKRIFSTLLSFALLFTGLSITPNLIHADDNGIKCQEYSLNVKLTTDDLSSYKLYGELCYHGSFENKPLQLLIHGATYNRNYWDFDYQPETYSYVRTAVLDKYVTFNVDRLGSGKSDKVDGLLNNLDNTTYTMHQVAQALRDGSLTGYKFNTIIVVGHSFGSLISVTLASHYQGDVDGVILTGYLHNASPAFFEVFPTAAYPAQFDPKFGPTFPANYFTTIPGKRGLLFYNTALADPNVIAKDEEEKDVVALGLVADSGRHFTPESLAISVPVYIITGENDFIYCGGTVDCSDYNGVYSHESQYFSPAAQLELTIIPGAGHSLNLHTNAQYTYSHMLSWADSHFNK